MHLLFWVFIGAAPVFATEKVALISCYFALNPDGRWEQLVTTWPTEYHDFAHGESVLSAFWNGTPPRQTGACWRMIGTEKRHTLTAATVRFTAKRIDGWDEECTPRGVGIHESGRESAELRRGQAHEVTIPAMQSGEPAVLAHTYFLRFDELAYDLGEFATHYCGNLRPESVPVPIPEQVHILGL